MSVTEPGDDEVLGSAVTSTLTAAGGGGVTVLVIWKFIPGGDGVWSLAKTINGMLAGQFRSSFFQIILDFDISSETLKRFRSS